jgi:serine/threonine-protein kinase
MEVKRGVILGGKYRIETLLGQGGGGVVVAATHLQLEQRVALKFLSPIAMQQPDGAARFAREARAAASIRSEHVARVLDVDVLESGMPYMVMEYLEGYDLSQYMSQRGPLPVEEAVELTLQACEALAEAHSLGIVHRDLKPANLFLARFPDRTCIKILDFGISKMAPLGAVATERQMTGLGMMMGSPYYMSPEQIRTAHRVDARADIWAMGVVLYELVTGRLPFLGTTLAQVCWSIMTQQPEPVRKWRNDAAPRFEAVVLRCLEKERRQRFGSVLQLAGALAEFAPHRAALSLERITKFSPPRANPDHDEQTTVRRLRFPASRVVAWAAKRRPLLLVLAIAMTAAFFGGAFARQWLESDRAAVPATSSSPLIASWPTASSSAAGASLDGDSRSSDTPGGEMLPPARLSKNPNPAPRPAVKKVSRGKVPDAVPRPILDPLDGRM